MSVTWNLWHGCHKFSEGCLNCYVYRGDKKYDRITEVVVKTSKFWAPIEKNRKGEYKIKSGEMIYTCFSSDFLISDADEWRKDAWDMMRTRSDCMFLFITKRIERFHLCVPPDWNEGWDNVIVVCTCENQKQFDYRMPIFLDAKIKHKGIALSPLISRIDVTKFLTEEIEQVIVGGESCGNPRVCDYNWVLEIKDACVKKNVSFYYQQTGTYLKKDGKVFKIARKFEHAQSRKANINFIGKHAGYMEQIKKDKKLIKK